jgi:hypothetical protein
MFDLEELDKARVRWQLGHHLFFAYVQGLIMVCGELQTALDAWPSPSN